MVEIMNKVVDSKFFKFIGANMCDYKTRVEKNLGLESICGVSREELAEKQSERLRKKYFPNGVSTHIWKEVFGSLFQKTFYKSIGEVEMIGVDIYNYYNIYEADIEYAVFLLLGSYLSEWVEVNVVEKNLPFSIGKMKKRNGEKGYMADYTSAWCMALKNMFKQTTISSLLQEIKEKTRVEKYSYLNMIRLREELDEEIQNCRGEQQKTLDRVMDDSEKERHNSFFYMTDEGIENQIVLDMLFNISLSEICYFHLRNKGQLDWTYIEPIVKSLAKLKCPVLRNQIADKLFAQYLVNEIKGTEYWEQMIKEFDLIVKCINCVYSSLVYRAWAPIYSGISREDEKILWKNIIQDNPYPIEKLYWPQYEKVLSQDIYKEKGIVKELESDWENMSAVHQYEMLQELFGTNEKYTLSYLEELNIEKNDIEKLNNEKLKEAEKRGYLKNAKSASELYIKLQCIMRN